MEKARNVINYYLICNRLKDLIRTGWKDWNVQKERIESVAEHVYGTQMLAIAMASEYKYHINLYKVILMLAIHELEETIIGDYTIFEITKEKKNEIGHEAVEKVLANLTDTKTIKELIYEFDERKTLEAKFAYYCDKLEADIQCKIYDEHNYVDISNITDRILEEEITELKENDNSWSKMWINYGQKHYNYDNNFLEVSNYLKDNDLE